MTDKFKPCPFCGGTPTIFHNEAGFWWCVRCDACRYDGPYDLGESGAIEQWNTRPMEDALLEALEEIAEWWSNWMPDDAYDLGGRKSLQKARAAIAKAKGEA